MERRWVTSPSYEAAIRVVIEARDTLGISQRELAERMGKPRSSFPRSRRASGGWTSSSLSRWRERSELSPARL